jgi:hypothetical protein
MRNLMIQLGRSAGVLLAALFVSLAASTAGAQVANDRSVGVLLVGVNEEGAHWAGTQWTPIAGVLRKDTALRVAEDPLMEAVSGKTMTPQEAGAAMKVRYVLTGGVTAGSHAFRFDLKLFDAKDGKQVWATVFQSDEDNIATVPTEIGGQHIPALKALTL